MNDETQTQTPAEKATRRKWHWDSSAKTLTMKDGTASAVYDLSNLPDSAASYLLGMGATLVLSRADDPDATYDMLKEGKPIVREATAGPWRQAIAKVIEKASKKAGTALTPAEAAAKVAVLGNDDVTKYKSDPAVIVEFNKITGKAGVSVAAALLAA